MNLVGACEEAMATLKNAGTDSGINCDSDPSTWVNEYSSWAKMRNNSSVDPEVVAAMQLAATQPQQV